MCVSNQAVSQPTRVGFGCILMLLMISLACMIGPKFTITFILSARHIARITVKHESYHQTQHFSPVVFYTYTCFIILKRQIFVEECMFS